MPPAVLKPNIDASPVKVAGKGKDWGSTFPESMDTVDESTRFMSRLMYLTLAHVLESRRLLPAHMFKKRAVNNMIRTYVMNTQEKIGVRVVSKFVGAIKAIELGYLDEFMIVVSVNDADPDDAIEVFSWKMHYNDDGTSSASFTDGHSKTFATLKYMGPEMVKDQTKWILLLARKLCRQLLAPLPANAYSGFRVTYTAKAPKGYQAEGFYRSPVLYNLDPRAREVIISGVASGHHKALLAVKSIYVDDEYAMSIRLRDDPVNGSLNESFQLNNSFNNEESHISEEVAPVEVNASKTAQKRRGAAVQETDDNPKSSSSGDEKTKRGGTRASRKRMASPVEESSVVGVRGSSVDPDEIEYSPAPQSPVKKTRAKRGDKKGPANSSVEITETNVVNKLATPGRIQRTCEVTPEGSPAHSH